MVAERDFVEVVFAGELDEFGAALRAAPVAVELAAFFEAGFYGDVLEIERDLRVFFCHALQEFTGRLVCKIALDVYGSDFAIGQKLAHSTCKFHQQYAGILTAAYSDKHLVSVFNQVEVVKRFGDFLANAFANCVGHFFRLKRGSLSRRPVLICL